MKIYGLKNCDTCRKALKALEGAEIIDVRADGMPTDLLDRALLQFGDALLNTRSTTWRGLTETDRAQPARALLLAQPALMKRPLILRGDDLFLGWGKDVQAQLIEG
ncbi:ArsC/Spx/MgsR family protein [Mesobacterium sp. TK19101]|uniref:ArsC/Spx/MgsR family protein n=1 Tax=Mesobacterium hydrothermale TaxID=3111907 RepID=A0ABU6HE58_9RHOB|nr:ArsC/Spx/MgsR family protein [Mesobacterium sp. TK19101]MEC3859929.1 ArsC/Spx/MgsR family protein [Mesobacterium sp. TK19101]